METALTKTESNRLAMIEVMIERGFKSFVESGKALAVVRDEKLYRASHKTFNEYCKSRWGLERTYAHRLIESAEVVNRVVDKMLSIGNKIEGDAPAPAVQFPSTESQARELARAPEDEQVEVWGEVVQTTAKPTAKDVKAVVEKRKKAKAKTKTVSDSKPAKEKVFKADAPMPEWYMDDNSVAIPEELYPAWRAKQRYSAIGGLEPTFDACQSLKELGEELGHEATVAMAKELRSDIAELHATFRRKVGSVQPSVVIDGRWYSKSEVSTGA